MAFNHITFLPLVKITEFLSFTIVFACMGYQGSIWAHVEPPSVTHKIPFIRK